MDWFYAGLILGCLVYVGSILVEYTNYRTGITPKIKHVEDSAIKVGQDFVREEETTIDAQERVGKLKMHVDELRRHRTSLFSRLVTERERKQRLEIAVFRKRLKNKTPLLNA